ncbi:MAG: glycosyltransferase, partial [Anaerolineales bacterium]|nr:glycosyltransferase [Anaerolineales bacterium]
MATKVLDLAIEDLPVEISELEAYTKALILYRYRGLPVGKAELPVVNGRLNTAELTDAILNEQSRPLWEQTLRERMGLDDRAPIAGLPKATVAVCTRDRPDDIRRCLEGFMQMPDDGQEFLVIDNCPSTDATQKIVAEFGERVRYVREDRPGLNIARNRALREAKHEIIAFNDDDAVPDPNWLRALLQNFTDPDVLCVTGLTMPLELETKAQEWFERYSPFGRGFSRVLHYGSPQAALGAGRVGAGANMALRRDVLQKIGPFDEALDAGTPTLSGGDTEMFARIMLRGFHIVYDPAALSWHRHRKTWDALRRAAYGYGVGTYAFWTRMLLKERKPGVL